MNNPRVTPAQVDAAIVSEWYLNVGDAMPFAGDGKEYQLPPCETQPPVPRDSPLRNVTLCVLVLRNGHTVHGIGACVSAANFDETIGRRVARENAVREIWPLLGYALREDISKL